MRVISKTKNRIQEIPLENEKQKKKVRIWEKRKKKESEKQDTKRGPYRMNSEETV